MTQAKLQDDPEVWKTNELLMAATLSCYGFSAQEIVYSNDANSTFWKYKKSPELLAVVAQFILHECRVEPKRFNKVYVGLKDEMFELMREIGVNRRPARARA